MSIFDRTFRWIWTNEHSWLLVCTSVFISCNPAIKVHPASLSSTFTRLTRDLGTPAPLSGCDSFLEGRGDHRLKFRYPLLDKTFERRKYPRANLVSDARVYFGCLFRTMTNLLDPLKRKRENLHIQYCPIPKKKMFLGGSQASFSCTSSKSNM